MSSKNTSDAHNPSSESEVLVPVGTSPQVSRTGEDAPPPAKIRKVEPDPQSSEDDHGSQSESTPKPASSPCTCRCGGCCCHGTTPKPQHCVRCHTDYRLNHPEACAVPHVFSDPGAYQDDFVWGDMVAPSVCCGSGVRVGDPFKGDWEQPFPCFLGWHTTDVGAVQGEYNGVNILRCAPDSGGKCQRTQMKHSACYEILYDEKVEYTQVDKKDHGNHLKKKRAEMKDDRKFRHSFNIEGDLEEDDEEKGKETGEQDDEEKPEV